jgi:hypothetical protein
MANVPISNLTTTWNNVSTTFTGIKLNVTDTASASASLLMDLQLGGVSKFKVPKNGNPVFVVPTSGALEVNGNGDGFRAINGGSTSAYGVYGVRMGSNNSLSWGSSADGPATADTILVRDAANTLAQRNGVNAQTFRLYNTFTDASNYERGFMRWSSNTLEIGTENAGTGASRALRFYSANGSVDIVDGSGMAQINFNIQSANGLRVASDRPIGFTSGAANGSTPDTTIRRVTTGILGVRGGAITDPGALSFIEQTAPAAPAANGVYIYAKDNGAGKTQLMALFATGAAVQIAIEP